MKNIKEKIVKNNFYDNFNYVNFVLTFIFQLNIIIPVKNEGGINYGQKSRRKRRS